ncbi:RDD family protein [Malacoplasma iowae]|uniref:RDD domain-containing protein n=2 Tax=Malacoplasma iowae TaxID=2116 RepID=A0A084U3U6_MALIO|nr:RDD family protein [Malacoplasma iowae]EGZ31024.1 hypothetical protein GUU_04184 [Malacoplasma iowae 695]KFB07632.1 hypothetical protein P271_481 [Malacoplasma iowae DK-CPA]QHG90197.1 bestrophin family protein [Malacoplasma iowae 695]WPL36054.1 RDD family protein [Malacoplasma iowae]WPL38348.1 RDD family protein [Malacoplasma iowae]
MKIENKKATSRYNLASATSRLFSKFFDYVLVVGLVVGLAFLFFKNEIIGWKFLVYSILVFLTLFLYFCIVPFIFSGYTFFSWLFKIRCYSVLLKNLYVKKWLKNINWVFLLQLFKRELFLWVLPSFILIIVGIITVSYYPNTDATPFFLSLYNTNSYANLDNTSIKIISSIMTTLWSISSIISLVIVINIIFTSKKRSLNDYFSNTVIIKMIDVNSDDPSKKMNYKNNSGVNIKYGLPGEIVPDAIETIGDS